MNAFFAIFIVNKNPAMILRESYRRRLQELAGIVSESKQSENMGLGILSSRNIPDAQDLISQFAQLDRSNNKKNIPVMAFLYDRGSTDVDAIADMVNQYNELDVKKRIKPIQLSKTSLKIGQDEIHEFLSFSEYVHAIASTRGSDRKLSDAAAHYKAEKKPMWSGNNIDIYEADSVGKCIAYTQGGLTDKSYSFCIGNPDLSLNMYKPYRVLHTSSFYFIVDRNKFKENADGSVNLDDPLHIVVFDNTDTKEGIHLTDAKNKTDSITGYSNKGYIDYLKSMGVPVEKLKNRPKTEQEKYEDKIFAERNPSLEWFKNLDNPYNPDYRKPDLEPGETAQNYYKSAYINRTHLGRADLRAIKLSDEQFDYLLEIGAKNLIRQYIDSGVTIPESQLLKLSPNEMNTYMRKRLIFSRQSRWHWIKTYEFMLMNPKQQKDFFSTMNENHLVYVVQGGAGFDDNDQIADRTLSTKVIDKMLSNEDFFSRITELLKKGQLETEGLETLLLFTDTPDKVIDAFLSNEAFFSQLKLDAPSRTGYDRILQDFMMYMLHYSSRPDKLKKFFSDAGISREKIERATRFVSTR